MPNEVKLLQITEAGRVVAEATLIIHDPTVALRTFYETMPNLIQAGAAPLVQAMQLASADAQPPDGKAVIQIDANHTGLTIAGQMPNTNGHMEPNRAMRRAGH